MQFFMNLDIRQEIQGTTIVVSYSIFIVFLKNFVFNIVENIFC